MRHILFKIGGLRQVNPELMSFIFSVVSQGTPTEGADFSIMALPIIFHCRSCNRDVHSESAEFVCPICGGRNVELLSGLQLAIELLEVEKDEN